jgi:hypothetical protein
VIATVASAKPPSGAVAATAASPSHLIRTQRVERPPQRPRRKAALSAPKAAVAAAVDAVVDGAVVVVVHARAPRARPR